MSHMIAVEPQVHGQSPTFDREGRIVQELAAKAGPASRQFFIGNAQTWLNAFCLFRDLENRIGLPESENDKKGYFLLLSVLIASGDYLLTKLDRQDTVLHEFTGVSLEAFRGCVDLLKDSM